MSFISKNLVFLRKENKYTQADISGRLGIAKTTYASYEYGKAEPDTDTLLKISDIYKVEIFVLLKQEIKKSDLIILQERYKNRQKSDLNTDAIADLKPHYPSNPLSKFGTAEEPSDTENGDIKDELIRTQKFTIDMLREALAAAQERLEASKKGKK